MSTTLENSTQAPESAEGSAPVRTNPARRGPILLATDGSSTSGAPLLTAQLLAERLGLPLEIVTVLPPQMIYGVHLGGTPVYMPAVEDAHRKARLEAVNAYVARFTPDKPVPTVHVRFGGIGLAVGDVARQRNATMIVVGAAPHRRWDRVIAGERAVQVLRTGASPVLSVPPGFSAPAKNVVVAVDFSPASIRAAQAALLLLADGGTLTLLHLISPIVAGASLRDSSGRDPVTAVQSMFERLRDELRPYVPDDVTVETQVRTADAIDGIINVATELDADVVAVGTHGPRLLERFLLGSVAASVVQAAPSAVLAAPPPPLAEALDYWLRVSGTATVKSPSDWAEALDSFTRRNSGRPATVEIDDPELGAQIIGRGHVLTGVTYDPHDRRAEIMLRDEKEPRRHMMHSIPNIDFVAMTADENGHEALALKHGRGQTLVIVGPA